MPKVIRRSRPSDTNLPRIVGGRRVTVTIHRTGRLAGHTTIEGDQRSLRVLPAASTWRPLQGHVATEAPEPVPKDAAWALEVLSGSVKVVKASLAEMDRKFHSAEEAAMLRATEEAGANRAGVFKALDKWDAEIG